MMETDVMQSTVAILNDLMDLVIQISIVLIASCRRGLFLPVVGI